MKKSIIFIFLLTLFTTSVNAQSSMTDDQIIQFAMKEREAGTSTQQIVIKLMQKGVDRQQLMRVRKKVERMQKEQGLGALSNSSDSSNGSAHDRTR